MATPHIGCEKGDIASNVIMPGDPLRAKYIAENYLEDYKLVNEVRNMLGYTGTYKGKRVTVFASGMGVPSIGIYSYELYSYYGVKNIIRIGTCGSFNQDIKILDVILSSGAYCKSYFDELLDGVLYCDSEVRFRQNFPKMDFLSVEMEAFGLFYVANKLGKEASCLMTVVDSLFDKRSLTSEDREKSLNNMIELALNSLI